MPKPTTPSMPTSKTQQQRLLDEWNRSRTAWAAFQRSTQRSTRRLLQRPPDTDTTP